MKVIKFCVVLFTSYFLLPLFLCAQTPEWVYQYENPPSSEYPCATASDSVGNTYTTGCIFSGSSRGLGIIKLNTIGGNEWLYFNDTLGNGEIGMDVVFEFNRVYLTGGTGMDQLVVLSVDTLGQELWLYLDSIGAQGRAIVVSSSHHIYVCGIKYPSPPDWVVLKLDSLGNLKWRYVYDGPAGSYDEASSIAIDRNENIYVGGYSTGVGTSSDFTVIKLDSAGNEKWVYRYDGPASDRDELNALTLDTLGNIYMTGWSWGIAGACEFCAVKIDSSGQEQWVYRYDGPVDIGDYVHDLAIDDSGNVYICGGSMRADSVSVFTVIKIDSAGNEQWCYFDAGQWDRGGAAVCVVLDGLGHIYVGGNFINHSYCLQIALVKLIPSGDTLWRYIYPHIPPWPWDDAVRDVVADINGNVYVAGEICVSAWDDDIVVMKFAGSQGIVKEADKKESSSSLGVSIFRGGIEILPRGNGDLRIYDVLGRMVVKDYLRQNKKVCYLLSSGVYFLKIDAEDRIKTRKVVVIR